MLYLGPLPKLGYQNILLIESKNLGLYFSNGQGVRRLQYWEIAEYSQSVYLPIANEFLIYTFLGMTDDGVYIVAANFPVMLPFLCDEISAGDDGKPSCLMPLDAIPFDYGTDLDGWMFYNNQVNDQLDNAPEDLFTPLLSQLDTVIESLLVEIP